MNSNLQEANRKVNETSAVMNQNLEKLINNRPGLLDS